MMRLDNRKPVIFCDFDGTITENDNIIELVRHFNPPGWEAIVQEILDHKRTIRSGVAALFQLLPTNRKDEIIAYAVGQAVIRDGFKQLLDFCREHGVEFLVTSGGIDFFVYPILAQFDIDQANIYCNGSDFSGDTITITWPHSCDEQCNHDCGMCKPRIIRRYPGEQYKRIVIGDSVTDLQASKLADLIYARHYLAEKCQSLGLAYVPYSTFHDITEHISKEVVQAV